MKAGWLWSRGRVCTVVAKHVYMLLEILRFRMLVASPWIR